MSYDFHGSWESFIGFNAPLYSKNELSVDYAIKYWMALGASPDKLNLGLATYGRSFKKSGESNVVGAGASGAGTAGRVSTNFLKILKIHKY